MDRAKIFYAKHIEPGIVQYANDMLLVQNDVLNRMDPTFIGCPVLLEHIPDEKIDVEGSLPVGFVISSFFNQVDGCHWCQFEVHSDDAERAIAGGYRVSNSYRPLGFSGGGEWHNIPYNKELDDGRYVHLALVRNPRYEGSVILTPDEYRLYNDEKRKELPIQNSKDQPIHLEKQPMIDDDKDIKERGLDPIGYNEEPKDDLEALKRRIKDLEDKIEEHNSRFEKEEDRNTERLEKGIRRAKEINREEDRFMRNDDDRRSRREDRRDGRWDRKHMDDMRDLWIRYWDSLHDDEREHAMSLLKRIRDDERSHGEYEREWSEKRRDNAKEDRLMAARINGPEVDALDGFEIQTRSLRIQRGAELY